MRLTYSVWDRNCSLLSFLLFDFWKEFPVIWRSNVCFLSKHITEISPVARIRPAIFHNYDVLPKLFPHYLSRNFIFRFGKGSGVGITAGQVSVKTKFSIT